MHLPGPVRAAVGLVASAADEAKRLPDRALELPMFAVSTALQASVRAQQRYARLTARGDEVLNRSRPTDEPPEWAQFDAPVAVEDLSRGTARQRGAEPPPAVDEEAPRTPAKKASAQKSTAQKYAAQKYAAQKSTAQKSTGSMSAAQKSAAKATAARKTAAKKVPPAAGAAETAAAAAETELAEQPASPNGKAINKPRHTAPSRFDDAADD